MVAGIVGVVLWKRAEKGQTGHRRQNSAEKMGKKIWE